MKAAQGVKIIAKDLEKSLAGLPMYVAKRDDEVEFYRVRREREREREREYYQIGEIIDF